MALGLKVVADTELERGLSLRIQQSNSKGTHLVLGRAQETGLLLRMLPTRVQDCEDLGSTKSVATNIFMNE